MKLTLTFVLLVIAVPWLANLPTQQPLGVDAGKDWLRKGYRQYQQGEYGDAEVSFRRALAQNAGLAEANYNLAQALYQQQRYAEAVKYYVLAKQNLPVAQKASLFHNQGNALLKLNRFLEAASAYRQSLQLRPGYLPSQQNLSYVLAKLAEKKKDVIRNINQVQKQLNPEATETQKKQSEESSEKSDSQQADQANSDTKSKIESPQEQLNASDMEQMLKQLDQAEKQIRGRASNAKAEKKVKTEEKDW